MPQDEQYPSRVPAPESPKPPYDSPISYKIRDVDRIWDRIKGSSILALQKVGTGTTLLINPPTIGYKESPSGEGRLTLDLPSKRPVYSEIPNDPGAVPQIEAQLRKYVDDRLRVSPQKSLDQTKYQLSFTKITDSEGVSGEEIGLDYPDLGFKFTATDQYQTSEDLNRALELALQIFRVYKTEQYRFLGKEPPAETIIIYDYDGPVNISDFFGHLVKASRLKNLNFDTINLQDYSDEDHGSDFESTLEPDREAFKKTIKKLFGTEDDEALEGLRQSIVIEAKPDVSFEDIAGQDEAVTKARELAELLAMTPKQMLADGITAPRGIIFTGPPGTGKTMIAKALAKEAKAGFVYVKATDLASKWYGDAEKLARGVFQIAREQAEENGHCILYIDEVDSILPPRNGGGGTHEVTNKVIGTFLQEIDGLATKVGRITVVASTNIPEQVDPAFLSRMEEWIPVPLPQTEGRVKIFENHFAGAARRAQRESFLDPSINLGEIAQRTDGLSGRDIADLVQIILRKRALRTRRTGLAAPVTQEDILNEIDESAKTRLLKTEVRKRNQRMGFQPPPENQ